MSRETDLSKYRDTDHAENAVEEIGEERVTELLESAELVETTSNYFAGYHDGELGCVIRLSDDPVLERVYAADYPTITNLELSDHAEDRATERGFYNDEVLSLARNGVLSWDNSKEEQGIIAFNRFKGNTVLIPMNPSGRIKTVFSRQGIKGKLRIDGDEVDRLTRNYRKRKQKSSNETKYSV